MSARTAILRSLVVAAVLVPMLATAAINTATHPAFQDNKVLEERSRPINMSELTFRRITNIHELMADPATVQEALTAALELIPRVRGNNYEQAIALQTLGYIYVQIERYDDAIPVLRQAAELDAMPDVAQQQTMWLLANMYASIEDWSNTVAWLERWFVREVTPSPASLILAAQSRAQMGQNRDAIPFVRRAIEKGDEPKENWYQLLLAMHYELREYRDASAVLETMVAIWPTKKRYWEQLSGLYMELQDDRKSLATMSLMYLNGMSTEEDEILPLVRMYLFMEMPYPAAEILEREIRAGRVAANEEYLELLGNAWAQARENANAADAFGRAAALSEDGELFVRQAQILVQMQRWNDVIDAVDSAVALGDLDKPGRAYLLQGMAAAELKDFSQALIYFNRAAAYENTRDQARQWSRYMQNELIVNQSR
jgi:tetratricopeptide (TPR) repeat protein